MKAVSTFVLIATIVMMLGSTAQATAEAKPDFAPMTYFVGLWNCKFLKNPDPKLVDTSFSFAGATDPDGYWEVLDLHNGRINITRDPAAGQWTWIYLGNGGDYSIMTTPGWSGATLTLKEVMAYGGAPLGDARFTKVSDTQYRASYSARSAAGSESYETLCTRV
jgi:hypothetical protein